MRDKFSDLIAQGMTSRSYQNIAPEMPQQDPICRLYNNVFSIPTDTRMTVLDNGNYVITGHMINTPNWDRFVSSPCWANINFYQACGAWCLSDFLYKYRLAGTKGTLNGDVVYNVEPISVDTDTAVSAAYESKFTTNESQIPHPITELVVNGDANKFKECFAGDILETVNNLNNSLYVKGNQWTICENKIIGLLGETVIIL